MAGFQDLSNLGNLYNNGATKSKSNHAIFPLLRNISPLS